MRPLTASEVEFTLTIEPEDIPVRGNALCSGDDVADKEVEDELIERLDRGDEFAWCCIMVKAVWNGYTGYASLGGCSFAAGPSTQQRREVEEQAKWYDMHDEALANLNHAIVSDVAHAKQVEKELS